MVNGLTEFISVEQLRLILSNLSEIYYEVVMSNKLALSADVNTGEMYIVSRYGHLHLK